jgi:beta-lactamase regulating signal transducer with metallopeptidase domain
MTTFADMLPMLPSERLGWTLLHSLWQFAVVGALLWVVLVSLRRRSADVRYVAACGALAAMLATSVLTFHAIPGKTGADDSRTASVSRPTVAAEPLPPPADVVLPTNAASPADHGLAKKAPAMAVHDSGAPAASPTEERLVAETIALKELLAPRMPWLALAWLAGVAVLSVRNLGGWIGVRRLRRVGTAPADDAIAARLRRLAARMKLSRPVRILQSALVEVPIVVGCLRPVILLPVAVLAGLSPDQLDAILAHELAHVRRHDYLVNLLQTVLEILFFYHPATWWISRRIRIEREHCCDDAAVGVCGGGIGLGEALTMLAAARLNLAPAMAVSGGSLTARVRRIVGRRPEGPQRHQAWVAVVSLTAIALACVWAVRGGADEPAKGKSDSRVQVVFWQAIVDEETGKQLVGPKPLSPEALQRGLLLDSDRLLHIVCEAGKREDAVFLIDKLHWAEFISDRENPRVLKCLYFTSADTFQVPRIPGTGPNPRFLSGAWGSSFSYRMKSSEDGVQLAWDRTSQFNASLHGLGTPKGGRRYAFPASSNRPNRSESATAAGPMSQPQDAFFQELSAGRALVFFAPRTDEPDDKSYAVLIAQAVAVPGDRIAYVRAFTDLRQWMAGGLKRVLLAIESARQWETRTQAQHSPPLPADAVYTTPDGLKIEILAVGRPNRWAYHWWNAEGVPLQGDPAWQSSSGRPLLAVVMAVKNPPSHLDFLLKTLGGIRHADHVGLSDCNNPPGENYVLWISDPDADREIQDYLDHNGRVEVVVHHGTGPWTEIATIREGQNVEAGGDWFHLKEVKAVFDKKVNKTGLVLIDGQYDFYDPKSELAIAAVDSKGNRIFPDNSMNVCRDQDAPFNTNRWYVHLRVDKADIDHFVILKRSLVKHVFTHIAVAPRILPDAAAGAAAEKQYTPEDVINALLRRDNKYTAERFRVEYRRTTDSRSSDNLPGADGKLHTETEYDTLLTQWRCFREEARKRPDGTVLTTRVRLYDHRATISPLQTSAKSEGNRAQDGPRDLRFHAFNVGHPIEHTLGLQIFGLTDDRQVLRWREADKAGNLRIERRKIDGIDCVVLRSGNGETALAPQFDWAPVKDGRDVATDFRKYGDFWLPSKIVSEHSHGADSYWRDTIEIRSVKTGDAAGFVWGTGHPRPFAMPAPRPGDRVDVAYAGWNPEWNRNRVEAQTLLGSVPYEQWFRWEKPNSKEHAILWTLSRFWRDGFHVWMAISPEPAGEMTPGYDAPIPFLDRESRRIVWAVYDFDTKKLKRIGRLPEEQKIDGNGVSAEAGFVANNSTATIGKPIEVTFYVKNTGREPIYLVTGGDGRSVRSYRFRFAAWDAEGAAVADPYDHVDHYGGMSGPPPEIKPGETYRETLRLDKWLKFQRPGDYRVYAGRTLQFGRDGTTGSLQEPYRLVHSLHTAFDLQVKRSD